MSSRPARLPTRFRIPIVAPALLAGPRDRMPIEHNPLLAPAHNSDKIGCTALARTSADPAGPVHFSTTRRILPSGQRS